jgi:hypothetical protein
MNVRWTITHREVALESAREEALARKAAMVEELRKAEVVRDRLQSLDDMARVYPEGHDMRVLLEELHLEGVLRAVEEEIQSLRDALIHPGGT